MIAFCIVLGFLAWEMSFQRPHAATFWSGLSGFYFGNAILTTIRLWS